MVGTQHATSLLAFIDSEFFVSGLLEGGSNRGLHRAFVTCQVIKSHPLQVAHMNNRPRKSEVYLLA